VPQDFESKHAPTLEAALEPGERLLGVCAAGQQKGMFKGGAVALGVTDRRLLVLPLSRRGEPDGEPDSIPPERVESARAGGAGSEWYNVYAGLMDHAAVALEIRTTDGEKLKLTMMRGEGRVLGKLAGGEGQRRGIEALAGWFRGID
jgi:hypothetical protein